MEISSSSDKYLESISSKYGSLDGELLCIDLSRNQLNQSNNANIMSANFGARNTNLGISLAGTKDRSSYKIFVCGIHPHGLCARDGRIKVGDQLIEANGVQLLGRSHLNAGAILQQLPGFHIKLVVLRKNDAVTEMAVRPITQFPVEDDLIFKNLRTSLLNQSLSNEIMDKFKNMIKIVTLKKDSKGLGLMITEGLHPDIGKGIFISGIHTGSVAENSELQISDMLVSVNQIQLINMDYDLALNLLKNMDGLITIIAIKTTKDMSDPSPKAILYQAESTNKDELISRLIDTPPIAALDENESNTTSTNDRSMNDASSIQNATNNKMNTNNKLSNSTNQLINVTNEQQSLFEDTKRKTNKKLIQDTDLRTNAILNGVETWIELNKGSNCALGIDLIDRTINDRKLFIIHEIIENGIAETDRRLQIGDVILQVNDIPLKEMNCEQAIEHLNRTCGSVKLLIYRELICINDRASNESLNKSIGFKVNYSIPSTMQENERNENVEQKVINGRLYEIIRIDLQKKSNKGLGICIVNDDRSPGPYINEILPNSTAHLEGHLKKGDHIVNVNGEDVSNCPINKTLAMLKCIQGLITLKIARLMPGQIVRTDEFDRNQRQQQIESPQKVNFKVIVLNRKTKHTNMIPIKRKPKNDRVKELIVAKDTDSVASFQLLNETVDNEWDRKSNATEEDCPSIGKNWIKIDKSRTKDVLPSLDQQLAYFDCPPIDRLLRENRIIEIDGQPLNSSNREKLIEKLKRSTRTVQMVIMN